MHRRTLLAAGAAFTLVPATAAQANMIEYQPGNAEAAINAGQTVLLDFAAIWCSTCRTQERGLTNLRNGNPAYDQSIAFYRVDWDAYGGGSLVQQLGIPRRSTLVLFRGGQEVGRLVAETRQTQIEAFLNAGL